MRDYKVFENGYQDENGKTTVMDSLGAIVAEDIERAFLVARASFPKAENFFIVDMGAAEGYEVPENIEPAPQTEREPSHA